MPAKTIDLITHSALRQLRAYTRESGQPTSIEHFDLTPMRHVDEIEITEEHITVKYDKKTTFAYNTNEITHREWTYKYNDDPEFVAAVARVIELSRAHLRDLPENLACPPGCAECCKGYEPFVTQSDLERIATHLALTPERVLRDYVNVRSSPDGDVIGWLRKTGEAANDPCVFLKGARSGKYYCGIYDGRPGDCRAFTPIDCADVDDSLPRDVPFPVGPPFVPKARRAR